MKATLIAIFLLLGSVAFAQNIGGQGGGMSAPYSNTIVMLDHTQHATQVPMGAEQNLFVNGGTTSARGERPLWEFAEESTERPLGDIAREYAALKFSHRGHSGSDRSMSYHHVYESCPADKCHAIYTHRGADVGIDW